MRSRQYGVRHDSQHSMGLQGKLRVSAVGGAMVCAWSLPFGKDATV
ncbi:MAG: hypothetical protein MR873_01945 [Parabacteroides sp.]|nr:hypothetical protein [Parabacteroides distasonis]MCI6875033.1 hypothetical protein [Parabacteroides sp.]